MIAILSSPRASWMGSLLRRISAVLVLAVAVAGCDQQAGITAPDAPRRNTQDWFYVDVIGPEHVETAGEYTYTANAYGGVGGYTYVWEVTRPYTGTTQLATTSNQATIYIGEGEGEALMRVYVQSGSQSAVGFKGTTNGIGCDHDYC